jgi:hypothetical protein
MRVMPVGGGFGGGGGWRIMCIMHLRWRSQGAVVDAPRGRQTGTPRRFEPFVGRRIACVTRGHTIEIA